MFIYFSVGVAQIEPWAKALLVILTLSVCAPTFAQSPPDKPSEAVPTSPSGSAPEKAAQVLVLISGVEDELLTNVKGFLPIFRFHEKEAPSVGRLRFLHGQSEEAISQALAPFGYYKPIVTLELNELDGSWQADYAIDPGERLTIKTLDISISGEASEDSTFSEVVDPNNWTAV